MGCQWVVDGGSFFEFAFFEERMGRWLKVEYSIFEFVFFEERMIGGWRLKAEGGWFLAESCSRKIRSSRRPRRRCEADSGSDREMEHSC